MLYALVRYETESFKTAAEDGQGTFWVYRDPEIQTLKNKQLA